MIGISVFNRNNDGLDDRGHRIYGTTLAGCLKKLAVITVCLLILCTTGGWIALADDNSGTWTASYDQSSNCIDITATPPTGSYITTTVTYWDLANPSNMQIAVSSSNANPLTFTITSSMIQQELGTGAPAAGNQYVVQLYFLQAGNTIPNTGGQTTVSWGTQSSGTAQGTSTVGSGTASQTPTQVQAPDWSEKMAAYLIAAPANWILNVFGLYDPLDLIYGNYMSSDTGTSTANGNLQPVGVLPYFSTFTLNEWNALTTYYDRIQDIIPIELVLVVVFMGIIYWYNSSNPDSKVSFRQCLVGLFVAMLLLRLGGMMFSFLFQINDMIVGQFFGIVQSQITSGTSFLTAFIGFGQDGYIGSAFLFLAAVFAVAVINWQYIMRKVVIAILIGILPLVAVISIIKREVIRIWFRELIANIFLQAAHAAVLSLLILLIASNTPATQGAVMGALVATPEFWFSIVALMGLPTIAGLVRRVIGAEDVGSGIGGSMAAGLGLASLFAVGKMLSGSKGLKSPTANTAGDLAGTAGDLAGTVKSSSPGSSLGSPLSWGGVAKATGRGALKVAGIAGTALGGLTGGMIGGAEGLALGAALGSKGMGLFTETTGSLAGFASNWKKEGLTSAMGMDDKAQMLDPGSMYAAGQNALGSNIVGKLAGAGLAVGSLAARPFNKDGVSSLIDAQKHVKSNADSIPELRTNLAGLTTEKQMATARFDQAKSLYGPKSEAMINAQAAIDRSGVGGKDGTMQTAQDQVDTSDHIYQNVQSKISDLSAQIERDPGNVEIQQQLQDYKGDFSQLQETIMPKIEDLRGAIAHVGGSSEYTDAKAHFEGVTAREADVKIQMMNAQKAITRQGLKEQFQKIRGTA